MPADMAALLADLGDESAALDAIIAPLGDHEFLLPTPAAGWSIGDQVSHLAYFDDAALLAATDPDQFRADTAALMAAGTVSPDQIAQRYRDRPGTQLRDWQRSARLDLLRASRLSSPRAESPGSART